MLLDKCALLAMRAPAYSWFVVAWRNLLARQGDPLPRLRLAAIVGSVLGEGDCEDCSRQQVLLRFGQVHVCRPCASRRKRAGAKVLEPISKALRIRAVA